MCALKIMGQIYIHVETGNGVLVAAGAITYTHRMTNILNANLVDWYVTCIFRVLDVGYLNVGISRILCQNGVLQFLPG